MPVAEPPTTPPPAKLPPHGGHGHEPRNPGLDVLRGLAIVAVVACHATSMYGVYEPLQVLQLGGKGVDLFFVLSGWLLGRQLILELRDTGSVRLGRFWVRRWLRTIPAYYAVLAATCAFLLARGKSDLSGSYLYFGQTYLTGMPYFGVSWSLCVEEHFYLLVAPAMLLFWRRRWSRLLVPVVLLGPTLCRHFGWYASDVETHVRYDPCVVGVGLAVLSVQAPRLWGRLCRYAPWLAAASLILVARDVVCRLHPEWHLPDSGIVAWAVAFGTWVLFAAAKPDWGQIRVPGVRYLADRSYAVYLLHIEALTLLKHADVRPFALYLLLTWGVTLALSEVLYRAVERPGMRLRKHVR
jgi:peptidoglycan/LPS O-acetylase OafA/YrhL